MSDPFVAMMDALFNSAMATMVDYEPASGMGVYGKPALVRQPDTEGDLGQVRISHDVRRFEIRIEDLAGLPQDPARGDRITNADGIVYQVQSAPYEDRLRLIWVIDAYKE